MIATLSLTIFLICGEPQRAVAEVGGRYRSYPLVEVEGREQKGVDPAHPHYDFISGIEKELAVRRMPTVYANKVKGCP